MNNKCVFIRFHFFLNAIAIVFCLFLHVNAVSAQDFQRMNSIEASALEFNKLRIGGPVFVPPALPTSSEQTEVLVGATLAGVDELPESLLLEEVSSDGLLVRVVAELRDNGDAGDKRAGDGRYIVESLALGSETESELLYRIRARFGTFEFLSDVTMVPITDLPLGFPVSDPDATVPTPDALDQVFTNELLFTSLDNTSPRLIRQQIKQAGNELGMELKISGYLPSINVYMLSFDGDTYAAIQRVAKHLEQQREIVSATPNLVGQPFADWWLENSGVSRLRDTMPFPLPTGAVPIYGSSDIDVAVIELGLNAGIDCTSMASEITCLPPDDVPVGDICAGIYSTMANSHGTKVGWLLAQDTGLVDEGGVAPSTELLPLKANGLAGLLQALNCMEQYIMANPVQLVNLSLGFPSASIANINAMEDVMCDLGCNNVLMVAASGNSACAGGDPPRPGVYGDSASPVNCSCGMGLTSPLHEFVLQVGAIDQFDMLGDSCASDNERSHEGEIYAPGWGIPIPGISESLNGTSWAAPLVTACAAIRGSVENWQGDIWDAIEVENRLTDSAVVMGLPGGGGKLNCHAAVQDPYDIVFLLDRSGSMNADAGTSGSRWDALRTTTNSFMSMLSAAAPPDSRIGLTLFSGSVNEPLGSGLTPISSSPNLDTHLSITPSGSTGMGAGLQNAVAKLSAVDRPKIVLLFTDGEQNLPLPTVNADGCAYSDGEIVGSGCPAGLNSGSVKIQPVGVGSPSTAYFQSLQNLANQHRGTLLITDQFSDFGGLVDPLAPPPLLSPLEPCATSIELAFDCTIAPALYGASLQMIESTIVPFTEGEKLTEFQVNKGVEQLLIKLSVPSSSHFSFEQFSDRLQVTKDGENVTHYFRKIVGVTPTYLLLSTDFTLENRLEYSTNYLDAAGKYSVSIKEDSASKSQRQSQLVSIITFADDHRLDMQWEVSPTMPRVGESFEMRVRLGWAGQPITNAQVVATVGQPAADLGNALALHPDKVDPASGPDASSPGWQKYRHLMTNDEKFRAELALKTNERKLLHVGDGWYAANFDAKDISGVYQIGYSVMVDSPAHAVIQRKAQQSAYIRFGKIDFERSLLSHSAEDGVTELVIKTVTGTGVFVGPGQGSIFEVTGDTNIRFNITDHQDGSYTMMLITNPESKIKLSALDEVLYHGPASFAGF